ncbi:MAG: hypothetical protein C4527_20485 [Candidatus Omnitrophota bacterium]|jgi:hypothetical protein|nr:MAG: hypothetical protein C4527_20485 [Candidatus Omnitrophota bacterium]
MAVAFYMDHNVPHAISAGLRVRGVDVLTAYEDHSSDLDDPSLLERAGILKRVLFTQDDDFLVETVHRQRSGINFVGIVYAHQLRVSIGRCIQDLEIIAKASELDDMLNEIIFLPL